MKSIILKLISLVICFACLLSFVSCSKNEAKIDVKAKLLTDSLSSGEFVENDNFKLSWNDEYAAPVLLDKKTGEEWSAIPEDLLSLTKEELEAKYTKTELKRLKNNSLVPLNVYFPEDDGTINYLSAYLKSVDDGNYSVKIEGNAIKTQYYFEDLDVLVPLDYILTDDGVRMSVNTSNLYENDVHVTQVEISPFFCSVKNGTKDSYLFYPSGSGAIVNTDNKTAASSSYTASVYGDDVTKTVSIKLTNTKNIYLPVFGAKKGDTAICGIISEGAEFADLKIQTNDKLTGYSYISTLFNIRGSNVSSIKTNNISADVDIYTEDKVENAVLSVDFNLLYDDEANYVGMAKYYQEKLFGDNEPTADLKEDAFSIKFIGGVMEQQNFLGFPYKSLYAATTFNQAKTILTELSETGVTPNVQFQGFGTTGLDVGSPAGGIDYGSDFGSIDDFEALTSYCDKNGIDSYVNFDLLYFSSGGSGVSSLFDAAQAANGQTVYRYYMSKTVQSVENSEYSPYKIVNRASLKELSNELLDNVDDLKLSGISFSTLSDTAYSDYSTNEYYLRKNYGKDAKEIYSKFAKKVGKVAANGTNAYAANVVDCIFETPGASSKQDLFDYDVPFYQIVFKGKVEITSESVNHGESIKIKQLLALETGTSQLYTIYNTYNSCITYSPFKDLYGAVYKDNKDDIFETSEKYSEYYEKVSGQTITAHEVITVDVRHTVFSNGTEIYVNYSDFDYELDDGTVIPKMGYIIK